MEFLVLLLIMDKTDTSSSAELKPDDLPVVPLNETFTPHTYTEEALILPVHKLC